MPKQYIKLDDLRALNTPENITNLFRQLGYNDIGDPLDVEDLDLSPRNTEAIKNAYLIADQEEGGLQVLLLQLYPEEWETSSVASTRMKAIANQVVRRETEFLLLATKDYNELLLVNPRKTFDDNQNIKVNICKLLLDRTNPTAYDRDRLEAIAVKNQSAKEIYRTQCEAFDVEKLTKHFYKGYKDLFERVQRVVREYNPNSYFEDADRLHQFSQRLLGRIMFLYFLQKKEFLAGDPNFLSTQYKVNGFDDEESDYYSEVLEPLFFETLNKERPNFESKWGKIPYLNGGLFDRDYGPGIKDAAGRETPEIITLPNFLFNPSDSKSILGYFNGYNFTIAENVAGDEDVALDPEMLGKVFENLLAVEERGKSGTFYTPRGIVQFMCTEVLARYLADESGLELEHIRQIMDADPDLPDVEFNALLTPQQARSLEEVLGSVKILDPAVGSGAFPLGMLQIIVQVRQVIARRLGMTVKRGSLKVSEWKREIIGTNLYGVDIKPEAIEIAKLRMWLSLVVDVPNIEDVEPLPNLDYKLMCGDSLISTINGETLIPDPTKTQQGMLNVTPIQQAIQPLLDLQQEYFDAQAEERQQLREQILEAEANVFRVAVRDRKQHYLTKQRHLEEDIQRMGNASKSQQKELEENLETLTELDKFAEQVETGERSLNFFQYHLHFRDVFIQKQGFDIVIGNPPYGVIFDSNLKQSYELNYSVFIRNNDIYTAFYEKGISLLKNEGKLSYISPNTFLNGDYFKQLRKVITGTSVINFIVDYKNLKIFDDPTVFVCVTFLTKTSSKKFPYTYKSIIPQNLEMALEFSTIEHIEINERSSLEFKKEDPIFSQIIDSNLFTHLGNLFLVKDVGFNYWTKGRGKKRGGNSIGKRVLYSGEKEHNNDIPYLKGKNIQKWTYHISNNYLRHNYQDLLNPEIDTFRFSPKFLEQSPKIIYRQTSSSIIATIDQNRMYIDKTVHLIVPQEGASNFSCHLLLGILNSQIILYLYGYLSQEKPGRTFSQVKTTYIKKIPIPKIINPDDKNIIAIENIVKRCLELQGKKVQTLERELNQRVAHLYGINDQQMTRIQEYI